MFYLFATLCNGIAITALPFHSICHLVSARVGIRQNIYTSGFFRTQKFTPKVRDSRQIQRYQKCVIRDKFNTKKVKKHYLYPKLQKKHWNYIQSPKYMQYMLLRTKKFTPKLRDSRQSNFLHHPLSRSPPEFLHQLGNFTQAALVPLVRFCISVRRVRPFRVLGTLHWLYLTCQLCNNCDRGRSVWQRAWQRVTACYGCHSQTSPPYTDNIPTTSSH